MSATQSGSTDLVTASLELAAERVDDLVPLVYERLFSVRPDLLSIFAVAAGSVPRSGMGNMVNEILRLMLADGEAVLQSEAQAAVVFHVGWGLDMSMYVDILQSVMAAVQGACADAWTPAMSTAWRDRLGLVVTALRHQHESIEGPAGA